MNPGIATRAARLQARALACVRGRRTLFEALDVQLGDGELLQVEGANGSGKTSLLRLLAGLARPSAGEVLWQDQPITGQRETFAQELLYIGHAVGMKAELTPLENLRAELALSGADQAEGRVGAALAEWGLASQARLPLAALSAGQCRRVALTRLALSDASLWILDEPFSALDVQAADHLGQAIERHLARSGMVVLTSHQALPLARAAVQTLRLNA
jgi:heme exporter protein A